MVRRTNGSLFRRSAIRETANLHARYRSELHFLSFKQRNPANRFGPRFPFRIPRPLARLLTCFSDLLSDCPTLGFGGWGFFFVCNSPYYSPRRSSLRQSSFPGQPRESIPELHDVVASERSIFLSCTRLLAPGFLAPAYTLSSAAVRQAPPESSRFQSNNLIFLRVVS